MVGQYREMGVLLWRGFSYDSVMAQCFGNFEDTSTKGKQMPVVGFCYSDSSICNIDGPRSTLVLASFISIRYHLRSPRKFHKPQGLASL